MSSIKNIRNTLFKELFIGKILDFDFDIHNFFFVKTKIMNAKYKFGFKQILGKGQI